MAFSAKFGGVCLLFCAAASAQTAQPPLLDERTSQCIQQASEYHRVNPDMMMAIVVHESRGNSSLVLRNRDNSLDVGAAGINSVHWPELRAKGVLPEHLMDACVSVYVGAWHLSKKMAKHGNNWKAVGAYHSETPYHNAKYAALIYNKLVSWGKIPGASRHVPSARRPG